MQNSRFSFFCSLILMSFCVVRLNCQNSTAAKADVGIILDLETSFGKIYSSCISMAIEDFNSNRDHSTMIVPHFRDSSSDVVAAASAAIDLLKNTQVMAILGPQKSSQADFVIDISDRVRIPIISPATSPALSPKESPYFIRSAWSSSSQTKAIAAIVKAFGWREVVLVYEDSSYGSGLVPLLTVNLLQRNAAVSNLSVISPSAKNDQLLQELYNLKAMQTTVLIVHMLPNLASRFFQMAKKAGMMTQGYAWIIADPLTSLLSSVDSVTVEAMQGVVGVKAYFPRSVQFENFNRRWSKRFHEENPNIDRTELNVFGLWAYDSTTALAEAIERVGVTSPRLKKPVNRVNSTDLEAIGTSNTGPSLAPLIRNFVSKGLSGNFNITNGQLQPSVFEIVNVIGKGDITVGFWTEKYGISKEVKADDHMEIYSTEKDNLRGILWPGQTSNVPKGWDILTSGKRLIVGIPVESGPGKFINVERDAATNVVTVSGIFSDVFNEVIQAMPYAIRYEYVPFVTPHGRARDYDDLVYQTFLRRFDVMMGDVTVSADRSGYVDFSAPFIESGVAIVIPIKDNESKNTWIFMKPLTLGLWLTIGAFFLFTGFVVWILENRINKEFQGPPLEQVGTMFWFSFSTLFFAHREKVMSNLTRFVVIVWMFVVLVLQSSYTANLASMLTVQQLQPNDINDLINRGEYIGFQDSSLIRGFLNTKKVDSSKLRNYSSFEEYNEALSKGSKHGGVGAIVDDLLSIKIFLSENCHTYTMIVPAYKTSGYGFAFQKGSPLVADVSRTILNLKEKGKLDEISRKWLGDVDRCLFSNGTAAISKSLSLDSFKGLFIIAGVSSSSAVAIFMSIFLYKNQHILTSIAPIKRKLYDLARAFDGNNGDKPLPSSAESKTREEMVSAQSSEIRISCDEGRSFPDDMGMGSSTIELQPAQDALPPQEAH